MKSNNILIVIVLMSVFFSIYLVSATTTSRSTSSYNATCMQSAVIVRETAIGNAYQIFFTMNQASFMNRSQALVASYGLNDSKARSTAVKNAWKTYQVQYKAIAKELRESRTAAWNTFNSDRKICKVKDSLDSESNEPRV